MATVFELLEHEWNGLSRDLVAASALPEVCQLAGGANSLDEVERFVRSASPPDADRVLLALVTRAVERDPLAARVLLQLLLPGVRRLARQWWALGDHDERAAAAITAVYHRILTYPLDRRPGRVAANILMDAAHELRRSVPRVVSTPSADPTAYRTPGDADGQLIPHPAEELAAVLLDAVQDGIIDRADAELIARSRIAGHRVADIAEHRRQRPRTLWDRRQRAEHALGSARTRPPRHPRPPEGSSLPTPQAAS